MGAGIARITALLDTRSILHLSTDPRKNADNTLLTGPLRISFAQVNFSYQNSPEKIPSPKSGSVDGNATAAHQGLKGEPALHDVSFPVEPAEVLGLHGKTGSGKTILSRLLMRFYDPTSGAICMGTAGKMEDIRRVSLTHLRERVGIVTQEIQLFHGSVRIAIIFGQRTKLWWDLPCMESFELHRRMYQISDESYNCPFTTARSGDSVPG